MSNARSTAFTAGKQAPQPQIAIDRTSGIACPCGGITFQPGMLLRRIPKLLNGTPQDGVMPVQVLVCMSCGAPETSEMDPKFRSQLDREAQQRKPLTAP